MLFLRVSSTPASAMLQIFETQEMLGLYGKAPTSTGNYFIATGDCGHILTGGTLAGMIISGMQCFWTCTNDCSADSAPTLNIAISVPMHACKLLL